jgi:hypothetical protein
MGGIANTGRMGQGGRVEVDRECVKMAYVRANLERPEPQLERAFACDGRDASPSALHGRRPLSGE